MRLALLQSPVLLAALLLSAPAAAVSCGGPQSVEQAYSASQDVFSARVESVYVAAAFGRNEVRLAKLRVLQVWKGSLKAGDVVSATAEESIRFVSDGFVPVQTSDILVYSRGEQPFVLHACSRSAPLAGNRDPRRLQALSKRGRQR